MEISNLNGVEFSSDELKRYMEIGDMTEEKSEQLSEKVKMSLAKVNFKNINDKVKGLLEDDEEIIEIIRGADIETIGAINIIGIVGRYILAADLEYGINKLIFFTKRRVFLVNTNYYNRETNFKEYSKDEIVSINNGKGKAKMGNIEKMNIIIAYILGIFGVVAIRYNIWINIIIYLIYVVAIYKLIRSVFSNEKNIVIKFNDGYEFEIAAENKVAKDLNKYLINE